MTWEESAPDGSGSSLKEPPDPERTEAPAACKAVKLNVHGRPVHKLCCRSVLAEGLIVCQPNTTTDLAVRAQDEKLVRR